MSRNYFLTVLGISALFIAGFLLWTGGLNPRPAVAGEPAAQNAAAAPLTPSANITIVPATLNSAGVPATLGTLPLAQVITGAAALAEFAQLHGEGFDLLGGYKAQYGQGQAVLWVAQAKNSATAQTMLDQMAAKIGPNNPVFQNLTVLDISGRTLYSAVGEGQQHFFYAVNDKLVWLPAAPEQAPDVLHSLWSAVQ